MDNADILDKVATAPAISEPTQDRDIDPIANYEKYEPLYRRAEAENVFNWVRDNYDDDAESIINLTDFFATNYGVSRENAYHNMDTYITDYIGKTVPRKNAWQQIKDGYTDGRISDKEGRLYNRLMWAEDDEAKKSIQFQIDKLESQRPSRDGNTTTGLTPWLESANNLLGTMVRPLITSAAVSALFPQSMMLTVFSGLGKAAPMIANIGAKALSTGVVFNETRKVETGLIYKDMLENGVQPDIARKNAVAHGIIAGALETASIEVLLARFPFMKKAAQNAFMKLTARERMTQGAVKAIGKIIADNALSIPIGVVSETTTEVLQEMSAIYFEKRADLQSIDDKELAKIMANKQGEFEKYFDEEIRQAKKDYYVSDEYIKECKDRIWDVAKQTAKGMAVFGLLGAGANTISDVRTNARQTGIYKNASEQLESMKSDLDKARDNLAEKKEAFQNDPLNEQKKAEYDKAKTEVADKEAAYNLTPDAAEYGEIISKRELTDEDIERLAELDARSQLRRERETEENPDWQKAPEDIEHAEPQTLDVGEQRLREIIKAYTPNLTDPETDEIVNLLNVRARALGQELDTYLSNTFQTEMARYTTDDTATVIRNGKEETVRFKGNVDFAKDGKAIITLTHKADFSTWVHELGHIFRRQIAGDMLAEAERFYGVKDGIWTVDAEERFTEDLTNYLMTRKAPNSTLEKMFRIIADALHNVYDRFTKRGEVSDDIARVFDQMFNDPGSAYSTDYNYDADSTLFQENPEERAEAERQYNEVVAKYKDTDQWMKAPNGQPTKLTERQWVQVRTPNFIRWFGDWLNDPDNASKVVDPDTKEPMVVYHGTTSENRFEVFDAQKGYNINAIWHSKDKSVASHWSGTSEATRFDNTLVERISEQKDWDSLAKLVKDELGMTITPLKTVLSKKEAKEWGGKAGTHYGFNIEYSSGVSTGIGDAGVKTEAELVERVKRDIIRTAEDVIRDTANYRYGYRDSFTYADFLNISNPLIVDADGEAYHNIKFEGERLNTESIAEIAKERNYDGVIINNVLETDYENIKTDDYITFDPTQIKSATDNVGTFSQSNPSILFQTETFEEGLENTDEIADYIKSKLESWDYEVEEHYSGLSNSRYVTVKNAGEAFGKAEDEDAEIRIANHDLPPTYDRIHRGDIDIKSEGNQRVGTNGDAEEYIDFLARIAKANGYETPEYDNNIQRVEAERAESQRIYEENKRLKEQALQNALEYAKENLPEEYRQITEYFDKADQVHGDKRRKLRHKANAMLKDIATRYNLIPLSQRFNEQNNSLLYQENEEVYRDATENGEYVPDNILEQFRGNEWADLEIAAREDYRKTALEYEDDYTKFLEFNRTFDISDRTDDYYNEVYNSAFTGDMQSREDANRQFLDSMTHDEMEKILNIIAKTDAFRSGKVGSPHKVVDKTLYGMMNGDKKLSESNYKRIKAMMNDDPDAWREFVAMAFEDQEQYELIQKQKALFPKSEVEKLRETNRQLRQDIARKDKSLKDVNARIADLQDTIHFWRTRLNTTQEKLEARLEEAAEDKEWLKAKAQIEKYKAWQKAKEKMDAEKIKAGMKLESTKEKFQTRLADQKAYYQEKLAELRRAYNERAYYQRLIRIIFKKSPKMCDITVAKEIESIQAQYSPTSMTDRTKTRLELALMDATNDKQKAKIMGMLTRKSLRDMTLAEVADLADRITELRAEGVAKRQQQLLEIKEKRLDIEAGLVSDLGETEKLDRTGSIESKKSKGRLWDRMKSYWWDINRLTEDMGEHWEAFFKDEVGKAYQDELRNIDRRRTALLDRMKELKLTAETLSKTEKIDDRTYTHDILLHWYICMQNADSMAALVYGNFEGDPNNKALMDKIESTIKEGIGKLSQEEIDLAEWMINSFSGDDRARLWDVFRNVENRSPEMILRYFPMIRQVSKVQDVQNEPLVDLGERTTAGRAAVKKNFSLERIHDIAWQHQTPLKLGAMSIYMQAIQNQEHYIAFAQLSKDMKYVYNGISDQVIAKYGQNFYDNLNKWIDRVINPNAYKARYAQQNIFMKALSNSMAGALAGNVVTMIKQAPSMLFFLPYCNAGNMAQSLYNFATDHKAMTAFAKEKSPYLANRNIDDVLTNLNEQLADPNSKFRKARQITNALLKPIAWIDEFACVVGWNAVYTTEMSKGATEAEAVEKANEALLKTQPQATAIYSPQAYNSGSDLMRTILVFTRQANQIYQMVTADMGHLAAEKQFKQIIAMGFVLGLNALLMGWIGRKFAGYGDDDEGAIADMAKDIAANLANNIPVVGPTIVPMIQRSAYTSSGYVNPISEMLNKTHRAVYKSIKAGEIDFDTAMRLITDAMGTAGLPKVMAWRAYKALKDEDIWTLFIGAPLGGKDGSK